MTQPIITNPDYTRVGTTASWAASGLVLAVGEDGIELDAAGNVVSIRNGNGVDVFSALPVEGATGGAAIPVAGTTYTLARTDSGRVVESTGAAAATITVPTDASVPFPVGAKVTIRQIGAGQVTTVGAGGVTLRSRVGLKTAGQYATIVLHKRAANEWVVSGDSAV